MVPNPPLDPLGGPVERAWTLITALLLEFEPAATLLELTPAVLDHYHLTLAIPGEIGKTLIVAARLVDQATTNPAARRALRAYLRSELLQQRSQRARNHASEIRTSLPTRFCPVCERPIMPGEHIVVGRAEMRHADCRPPQDAG